MSNAQVIWNYLVGKGLSDEQAAGVMGNLQQESEYNPAAENANEGAFGIAQWEGGRRTSLERFASSRGTSPTDLKTQLDFMWSELSNSGTLSALRNAGSVYDATSVFQSQYERSARLDPSRVTYANQVFSAKGNVSSVTSSGGSDGGAAMSRATSNDPVPDKADYEKALGDLEHLLTSIPELHQQLVKAIDGKMDTSTFLNNIHQTTWWKKHNDATRQLVGEQLADPAQYKSDMAAAQDRVSQTANKLGVKLNSTQLYWLAGRSLKEGMTDQTLQNEVGARLTGTGQGQAAALSDQIKQTFDEYGVPLSAGNLMAYTKNVLAGRTTVDTYNHQAVANAKSMYPSLSGQLDSGLTVKQIADPYINTMANLLEIDPQTIQLTDPTIKRALQGSVINQSNGSTTATSTPLYKFENQLRSDPRWAYTKNAKDTVSTALVNIGKTWGFM